MTVSLTRYDAACKALAEAKAVDEVKLILDRHQAMAACARVAKNKQMVIDAIEITFEAKRKLGGMILAQRAVAGLAKGGRPKTPAEQEGVFGKDKVPEISLADMGISHKLSSEGQKLATISEQAYKKMIDAWHTNVSKDGARVTSDLIGWQVREDQHTSRVNLQQALSDASAKLRGGRKFPVIYADPATKFRAGIGNRSIENHYPTMTMEQLCALPVADRCLPNCQLFVWSTVPQLAFTLAKILPAWGDFEYSSHCIWDKTSPDHEGELGTGFVFRNQHEVLIYAKRGKPPGPSVAPPSIYRERKREHSRKPDHYRGMIAEMTSGLPVLELFARVDDEHPLPAGFEAWGNQAAPKETVDSETGEITEAA